MKLSDWLKPGLVAVGLSCVFLTASILAQVKAGGKATAKSEPPPASNAETPRQPRTEAERKISPTDTLFITIVGETGLQTDFKVSASGTIQFPFLEVVEVAGLTPSELSTKLRNLLMQDYFVDPQVLVTVKDYRADFVTVIGQVQRPGPIMLTGERKYDIVDCIALAGGTTRLASNTIEYTHRGETRKLSLEKIKTEKDPAKRIYVEAGDIIEVRETWM